MAGITVYVLGQDTLPWQNVMLILPPRKVLEVCQCLSREYDEDHCRSLGSSPDPPLFRFYVRFLALESTLHSILIDLLIPSNF